MISFERWKMFWLGIVFRIITIIVQPKKKKIIWFLLLIFENDFSYHKVEMITSGVFGFDTAHI